MTAFRIGVVTAVLALTGVPVAQAQNQPSTPLTQIQGLVVAGAALSADSDDPIDDRGVVEITVATLGDAWTWVSYTFGSLFAAVTPPTPASMARDLQDNDKQSQFFALISDSGYKIKEIENGVGLPPDITIKFGRIRNLSDADIDYIDRELARWAKRDSGMVAEAQRAMIASLVAVNQSDSYVIDSVRLSVLPLPQVKFSLAPTEGGLSMENSVLMRAIQRLDRRLADAQKKS